MAQELFRDDSPAPPELIEVLLPGDEDAAFKVMEPLAARFKLHPLTVDDCVRRNQRCKLEAYDGYLFLVWHLYTPGSAHFQELQLCIMRQTLLVVATGAPPEKGSWGAFLFPNQDDLRRPLRQLMTILLDRLVDLAEDHLNVMIDGATALEAEILDHTIDPADVLSLKRLIRQFIRSMRSAQPIFTQLLEFTELSPEDRFRFRNVTDHMTRLVDSTAQIESQMATVMDAHWGALSARTNVQMQRLTTIATVFLPVSFWSGLFGMNFETMPFKESSFFLAGLGLMVGTWLVVLAYMYKRGAFTREHPSKRKRFFVDE